MRQLLLLIVLSPLFGHCQSDSIYIEFTEDDDIYTQCSTIYAANGVYVVQQQLLPKLKIPGTVAIHPLSNTMPRIIDGEMMNTLKFSGKSPWVKQLANYDVPSNYYVELPYRYIDSIIDSIFAGYATPKELEGLNIYKDEPSQLRRDSLERLFIIEENERIRISDSIFLAGNGYRPRYFTGILNGIYIRSVYLQKFPFFKIHPKIKDSLDSSYSVIRKNYIAPVLNKILQPYYFSTYEVTNQEYREFIQWVRDSIARDLIYFGLEDDEESSEWINYTDLYLIRPEIIDEYGDVEEAEYEDFYPSDRDINRTRFSLNWDKDFEYDDRNLVRILEEMYLPHPERFYRHRDIDTRKLIYRYPGADSVMVYPDTLGFKKILFDCLGLEQLYWHPRFNMYPSVNLTIEQINAYCHWKTDRINEEYNLTGSRIKVSIPTLSQYEFALKSTLQTEEKENTRNAPNTSYVTYERETMNETSTFLNKVDQTSRKYNRRDTLEQRKSKQLFNRWLESNQTSPFHFLLGNVSEFVSDKILIDELEYYGITPSERIDGEHYAIGANYGLGVKTKSDYQYNALFYKTLIKKKESSPYVGFRLVYTVESIK